MSARTRLIEVLIGLLATQAIVFSLALYMFKEPQRLLRTQQEILNAQLDEGMTLYAENCSVCHGLQGEGIGSNPPLNTSALASMPYDDLFKTIARGRYGTAMPAWSKEEGGPLSDYQISELIALIQAGDWKATGDRVVNLGLAPLVPFTTQPDPALLEKVAALPDGETLRKAILLYADFCVACHGADGLGTTLAPALNDPKVREKSAEELTRIIALGLPGTRMSGWQQRLGSEEISSLVTLIQRWDEIPSGTIPAPTMPVPTTAESLERGRQLYATNCARCHGPEGQGTPRAPALNVKSFLTKTSDQAMIMIISGGIPGTAMPAWGDRMSAADIQAIVGFIRQWEPTAPEVATPIRPGRGGPPWLRNATPSQSPSTGEAGKQSPERPGAGREGLPPWARSQANPPWWQTLNWPLLIGITAALSVAFTLIAAGISGLKKS